MNQLPQGGVLIILPSPDKTQRKTLERLAELLKTKACHVTTLPAEQFRERGGCDLPGSLPPSATATRWSWPENHL